jgi:hypothetical protein
MKTWESWAICFLFHANSVICIQIVDKTPKLKTNDFLGDLTYELVEIVAGFNNEAFVSNGQTFAFSVFYPSTENVHQYVK